MGIKDNTIRAIDKKALFYPVLEDSYKKKPSFAFWIEGNKD